MINDAVTGDCKDGQLCKGLETSTAIIAVRGQYIKTSPQRIDSRPCLNLFLLLHNIEL